MPTRAETRARRRALVQESLFLASPEGGECSYRAIVARLGYRDAASYDKALRRAGRDDVLYRVKRDPARLAEWLAARDAARRERRLRQLREYNETPERRAANAARMRRVRAEAAERRAG